MFKIAITDFTFSSLDIEQAIFQLAGCEVVSGQCNHVLLKRDNVIVSSHIASVSPKAVSTLRETAANIAVAALRGEQLPNIVNGVTPNIYR